MALVLCLGAAALLLTSWLAALAGYATTRMMGGMLNFVVGPFRLSPPAVAWQSAIALGVPVLAALSPVWNGTRITVREAISSYGLSKNPAGKSPARGDPAGQSRVEWLAERAAFLSRPLLLSLRNTFGRKARLSLTLVTLTLAGAVFISVFNLWASFRAGIAEVQKYYLANVSVDFTQSYNMSKVASLVGGAPGIARIEGWDSLLARILSPGEEKELEILLIAPPGDSTLIDPTITSGRWLLPTDENAIVIGNHILKERPGLKVGDTLTVKIGEKETNWVIVGTFRLVGNFNPPPAYVNNEYLARLLNRQGRVSMLRIITSPPDGAAEASAASALEAIFKQNNLQISSLQQGEVWRQQQATSFNVMIYFLLVMAALIAVVGGLGLAGTMSMNVLERSREIGVLRAVGAGNGSILRMVLVEVSLIGLISWALAFILSIPITYALDVGVGMAVFTMPIDFLLVIDGVIYWLAGILGISMLAAALPAGNAMRLTIREVLAYE
jgi:putative ABC transport system permease protein